MTFESMIDTPNVVAPANENANVANPIVNEEALAVKVSYGDEIRRATFTGTTYVALRDLCAKLFELDPATAVLKYQDDDGDKITVVCLASLRLHASFLNANAHLQSTDGEVQDALQGAKEKKILRLFVDVKAPAIPAPIEGIQSPSFMPPSSFLNSMMPSLSILPPSPFSPPASMLPPSFFILPSSLPPMMPPPLYKPDHSCPLPEERPATDAFHGGWGHRGFPMRGGFHHRGGFMPGFPGARGFGHHGFPHGGPHHGFSHGGPHQAFTGGFPHHAPFAPATPVTTDQVPQPVQAGGPSANYRTPRMFGHGVFSPADAVPIHHRPPFSSPYARCAFKEHKHAMKEQLRMMKANAATEEDRQAIKDFKDQMKAECKARWHEMKEEKKIHKEGWKAEKKTYKGDWKAEKAQWKEDKKCEKNDRLVARHVADVTVPDNSELPADTPVTKTWRLRYD